MYMSYEAKCLFDISVSASLSKIFPSFLPKSNMHPTVRKKEGNALFNNTLNTFYLHYMTSDIW